MPSPQRYWREIPQRYRLEASKCRKCSKIYFPPRPLCSECRGREFDMTVLPNEGKVYTFTVIHVGTAQFADEVPYVVGIIELTNGVKITAQIADCGHAPPAIGQKVRLEFRKIQEEGKAGILCYGYKAVVAL